MRPAFKRLQALPSWLAAKYLMDFYPQASAAILRQLRPWCAIPILLAFPPEYRAEVVIRMSRMLRPADWVMEVVATAIAQDLPKLESRQPDPPWWLRFLLPWLDPYHRERRGF